MLHKLDGKLGRKFDTAQPLLLTFIFVAFLLVLRLYLMALFPVYDTTEARYAEIARIMHETGNWLTPHIDYNTPFWGKPPVHTWMTAVSFKTLGVSAFIARLPHFICGLGVLCLVYAFAKTLKDRSTALLSVMVLTSSVGFFVSIGMVMTDTALMFSNTLAMYSFWRALHIGNYKIYGYVFFLSLALGMLIKGPVSLVIVGIALVSWCIWQRTFKSIYTCLPWFSGSILFLTLTLPWYILAEMQTPGFIEYFIWGEHIQRFIVPGWGGDLYGNAHNKPRGTIWLFWLIAAFPWSFLLIGKLTKQISTKKRTTVSANQSVFVYLMCWTLSPLLLFSFSGNILPAYVLPGFGAMAILFSLFGELNRRNILIAFGCLTLFSLIPIAKQLNLITKTSESELIGEESDKYVNTPLIYWMKRPFSAAFYSHGRAKLVSNSDDLLMLIREKKQFFIAIEHKDTATVLPLLKELCKEKMRTKSRLLLLCGT